jgi:hypothetical protein
VEEVLLVGMVEGAGRTDAEEFGLDCSEAEEKEGGEKRESRIEGFGREVEGGRVLLGWELKRLVDECEVETEGREKGQPARDGDNRISGPSGTRGGATSEWLA